MNVEGLVGVFLTSALVSLYALSRKHWNEASIFLFFVIASVLGIAFKLLQ